MSKILADLSVELWTAFRKAGFKTSVRCSKRSLSRYVEIKDGYRIRLSDHAVSPGNIPADYEIIATRSDDPKQKLLEASELAQRLLAGASVCEA